jgi:beta-glucosidase
MGAEGAGARFPDGFRWGTATAAHQIEGGNTNNDWWRWEHQPDSGCAEPSGDACDSWHRWPEDVALVAGLGLDHYRFSLEWSRIEPAPGEWSRAALDHYRRLVEAARAQGVEPIVTFHHFTTPAWLADMGGWEQRDTADRFARFVEVAAGALGGLMGRACTLNEPNVVATMGWVMGMFPPGRSAGHGGGPAAAAQVTDNLVAAHRAGVDAVRAAAPGVPVGLTLSMTDYQAAPGDAAAAAQADKVRATHEDAFLAATAGDDFLGVQTYTRMLMGPGGWVGPEPGVEVLPMGYEYWPAALEACLRRAWQVTGGAVPLWVTESGIGTDDDAQRIRFVHDALAGVLRALTDGVEVQGYTYWSLLDNFEWAFGYRPKFGLAAVDRTTFERTAKPSAAWLAAVARTNTLLPAGT